MNAIICDRCGVICQGYYRTITVGAAEQFHLCNPCTKDLYTWRDKIPEHNISFGKVFDGHAFKEV